MSEAGIDPPEESLTEPLEDSLEDLGGWLVVARNRRVNRNWEALEFAHYIWPTLLI
jgi:hypothetical protein